MAKRKWYAVKVGKVPGVYNTWAECQNQTRGVPGALFKSFESPDEANEWMKIETSKKSDRDIRVYVDGSFLKEGEPAGWGWVAVQNEKELARGNGATPEAAISRNIDGELMASLEGAKWLASQNLKGVIVHDYTGIAHWALKEWKAKSEIAIWYQKEIEAYIEFIEFEKVKAHSGEKWNDLVDELAKAAIAKTETPPIEAPVILDDFYSDLGNSPEATINQLIKYSIDNPRVVSLAAGLVDPNSFPVDLLSKYSKAVFESDKIRKDLQYSTTEGELGFRESICEYAKDVFDESWDSDEVIVGNGSQQILYLFSEICIKPGDIVFVEKPSYYVFMDALKQFGATLIGIDCDENGPLVNSLTEELRELELLGKLDKLKAFYTVSYCQNPSGRSHSESRKYEIKEILEDWFLKQPFVLIEDAAYRELSFENAPVSYRQVGISLSCYMYCGTFSKSLAPGLRLGYGVLPEELKRRMVNIKGSQDFGSSCLNQSIVNEYLKSKDYQKHISATIDIYKNKAIMTDRFLRENLPSSVRWNQPKGGLYFWLNLDESIDTSRGSEFYNRCIDEELLYVPGNLFFLEGEAPTNWLRITYAFQSIEKIEEGIKKLGKVLNH